MADVETWGWRAILGLFWGGIGLMVFGAILAAVAAVASCIVGFFALWAMLVG